MTTWIMEWKEYILKQIECRNSEFDLIWNDLDHSKACTLQHQQEENRLRYLLSNKEAEINESVVARKNLQSKSKNLESTLKTCQSSLDFWEKKCEKVDLDYGQLQNSSNKR